MANRWAQLGSAFGGGISAGLLQAFLKQAEEEQRKAEVAQQYQDMAALSRALGIPIPQYQPQSEAGLNIMQQMVQQQAVPESYTLGPGQRRYQGQKVVAEAPLAVKMFKELSDGRHIEHSVPADKVTEYEKKGWQIGDVEGTRRAPVKPDMVPVFKERSDGAVVHYQVPADRVEQYQKEGWQIGKLEGQMTQAQKAGEFERLRDQMARLMGYSDYAGLDPNIQQEVARATETARRYYEQGLNIDQAINKTLTERRLQSTIEEMPKADRGILGTGIAGNLDRAARTAEELINSGVDYKFTIDLLNSRGWKGEDVRKILEKAGIALEDAYSELRDQGLTPEQAKERLGL